MLWMLGVSANATCVDLSATELVSASEGVSLALQERDTDRLKQSAAAVTSQVACVQDPLTPGQVAVVLRNLGIGRFVERDRVGAVSLFRGARELEPDFELPTDLVGDAHPLRRSFEGVPANPGARVALEPVAEGQLYVDGTLSATVPDDRPYVFQHLVDGEVRSTVLLGAGERPDYPVQVETPPPTYPTQLGVGLGSAVLPNDSPADAFGSLVVSVSAPVAGPISVDGGLTLSRGFTAATTLPGAWVGAGLRLGSEGPSGRLGIGALAFLHGGGVGREAVQPVSVGPYASVGADVPVSERVAVGVEALGWVGTSHVAEGALQAGVLPQVLLRIAL